jgi:hypothetical protein
MPTHTYYGESSGGYRTLILECKQENYVQVIYLPDVSFALWNRLVVGWVHGFCVAADCTVSSSPAIPFPPQDWFSVRGLVSLTFTVLGTRF